ncbi:MAG: hypothetical protein AEth_01705 [Candidatus Argoarchaeum ethanivorans]|uniref:Uncharacterized protein n=1 Tax=Candidatus Argoarchaeum ethanivorans TaxID=2608793 RepID=A0A8B3S285_9EURY|nr:MAG: hypothetical protein AEth_01705 [Candidatus Argoarchaeum ethanivorans]
MIQVRVARKASLRVSIALVNMLKYIIITTKFVLIQTNLINHTIPMMVYTTIAIHGCGNRGYQITLKVPVSNLIASKSSMQMFKTYQNNHT